MSNPLKSVLSSAAIIAASAWVLHAATPKTAAVSASDTTAASPATAFWGMRGLSQTVSAEPMGDGRLTVGMTGSWYGQEANGPLQEMSVLNGIMGFCFGLNPWVDVFGSAVGYGIFADSSDVGKGSVSLGLRGTLPLPRLSPLLLGVQMGFIAGTTGRNINENNFDGSFFRTNADGYDYFETEMQYDFVGKFIESLMFGNDSLGIKIHFNQGAALMLQNSNRQLLLLGMGVQGAVHPKIVLGLELNSRTNANDINIGTDPIWLTPSLLFRTPYHCTVLAGVDVSLSAERDNTLRALEPFRLFGGIVFSSDLLAAKKRAEREKALAEKKEKDRTVREAQARSQLLEKKAHADSIAFVNARLTQKRRADSMAQKAREDSIKIADLKRKLEEERSKRPDAEKQLLSTGLLLLDAVYFESGKAQISINSFPYLNIIGKMLAKYPKLQIEVSGHTDNIGKYEKNISLSQARAEAVRRYMIQVAPDLLTRVSARGYGPTQPKATNTTKDGRKMNRRTELQVLNKEVLKEYN